MWKASFKPPKTAVYLWITLWILWIQLVSQHDNPPFGAAIMCLCPGGDL